jgi:hypothetical protein
MRPRIRQHVEGSVPELSEERRRQIRAEEEARFRAEQEAEERYREDVRKELETQQQAESEERYRERVRAELGETAAPKPTPRPTPQATVDAPPKTPAAPVARRRPSRLGRLMAGVLLLGGLASVGLAVERGFSVPFLGPPAEITLMAEDSGELVAVDELPSSESALPTEPGTRTPTPISSASSRPATPPVTPTPSPSGSVRRATLAGTGISIEVPPGWFVEEGDFDDVLEIRWGGAGVASGREEDVAYVLIQQSDLRPGEPMEEWAERMVEQVVEAEASEDDVRFERDEVIPDFHGVPALSIDIITPGYMPHHTRNYYWVQGGRGYILTCYATTGSFEERVPTFDRIVNSMRLSPEGR